MTATPTQISIKEDRTQESHANKLKKHLQKTYLPDDKVTNDKRDTPLA